MLSARQQPQNKSLYRLKVKGWRKYQKQTDMKKKSQGSNNYIRENRIQNIGKQEKNKVTIILKRVVQQEDITLINIYTPNIGATKYIRKFLEDFKKHINSKTVVGNFNTLLLTMKSCSNQNQ